MTKWTADHIATLRRAWDEGLFAEDIAKLVPFTRHAVLGKANRLKLTERGSGRRAQWKVNKKAVGKYGHKRVCPSSVVKTKNDLQREFEQAWRNTAGMK